MSSAFIPHSNKSNLVYVSLPKVAAESGDFKLIETKYENGIFYARLIMLIRKQ